MLPVVGLRGDGMLHHHQERPLDIYRIPHAEAVEIVTGDRGLDRGGQFDIKRAQKKLRKYVESHDHAIRQKAEIMIDHFHEQVMAHRKVGGAARAMVVTSGIQRAIQYFQAFQTYRNAKSDE